MACCCTNIFRLCKVPVCGNAQVKTGIPAPTSGQYTLVLDFLGILYNIVVDGTEGEELIFPASDLNEAYTFRGYILQPDGTRMTFQVGEEPDIQIYDCIEFETTLQYVVSQPIPPP